MTLYSKMKRAFLEEQVNKHMKDVDSLAVAVISIAQALASLLI